MQEQRNTWRFLSAALLAYMAPWLVLAHSAHAQQIGNRITIEAGDLRMVLETASQGLRMRSLLDVARNQELFADDPLPLFSATLRDTATRELMTMTADAGWRQVDVSREAATGAYKLVFDAPVDERLKGVRVEVTLVASKAEHALTWDLRIVNDSRVYAPWRVVFPAVSVRNLGADGRVFLPIIAGVELAGLWNKSYKRGGTYPSGWTSMQYMAAYNPTDRTGLYVAMHDPFGSTKDIFGESRSQQQAVTLRFEHPAANMGQAGAGFELPGTARWQLLRGDWFDAAQIYRAWASQEARWWPKLGPDGREDTPLWMRELPAWVMTGGAPSDCVPRVKAFAQAVGTPTGFHWYNWHQIPFDNDYPHYFPTKDGFTEGVAELKAVNAHPMPYINGRLWDTHDKGAEDWEFTRTARAAATKNDQGEPYVETYQSKESDGNSVKLAVMCPATELWQNRVRHIVLRLFDECGVRGVYIDQIAAAAPRLCFDASHGHELGGGHWWIEGYWAMLDAIRAAKPAECMLTTECNAEPYVKWHDGYLTWHWQEPNTVPAFPAVYGGTVQMFGRAYRGGPTQDLAHRMKAGQQLVFGEQIGWFGPEIIERPDSGPFLRDCIHLRWRLKEYFYRGHMARPPKLRTPSPKVTADWQWSGVWPVTTDAVLTGAWRIPRENKVVLLFANVSDNPFTSHLTLDPRDYGFGEEPLTVTALAADGTRNEPATGPLDQRELTLPARSVLAWEITPGRDGP